MGICTLVNLSTPQIDVVLAVFNGEKYLEKQVQSIRNQSILPTRLLVRDDCSTDKSLSLLKAFELPNIQH